MRQLKITKQVTNREEASLDKYLHEIGREELLTPEKEVELAHQIRNNNPQALERLVKANLRFVVSVAKQYQNQGLSLPDLINEGNVGLIKAAHRFDETKGFKFISYAVWWIRQAILQSLAEHARIVRIPLNRVGTISKINQSISRLEQTFERPPTEEEIANDLNLSTNDVRVAFRSTNFPISMDAPISSDEETTFLDVFESGENTKPDKELLHQSLCREIERTLSTLSYREAEIIRMFYGLNGRIANSLDEIGMEFDLTRERVRQLKGEAIKRLRKKSKLLKNYL